MDALADIRILDLSDGVAGAYCTKLFADYGADIIVIEPPGSGHPLRRYGPFAGGRPHPETGALWLYLGTNKRSVTLEIGSAAGRDLFRRLVEEAHVIVESFPPGHMESLGLDFRALRGIKRRIVLVSITPFGQTGPRAGWRATSLTSFASGGQMSLSGTSQRGPGGYPAEYQAGLQAFAAAATAAYNADALEVPQHIDISAQECTASALGMHLPRWAYQKAATSEGRGIEAERSPRVSAGPAASVHTVDEIPESARLAARGYFQEIDHPRAGRLTYSGSPFRMSEVAWRAGRAPLLGEHNEEIFCGELHLSRQELFHLCAAGVV